MPIEFRCAKCDKLLRTPDDTAGKLARCPACGKIMGIPTGAQQPGGATPPSAPVTPERSVTPQRSQPPGERAALAPAAVGPANPYQAPITSEEQPKIAAGKIAFGDAYGRTWQIFRRRWPLCILVIAVALALNFGLTFAYKTGVVMVAVAGLPYEAALVVLILVSILFRFWLVAGQTRFFLNVASGKRAKIADLFAGSRWILTMFVASILYFVAVFLGCILLIVPGVIVAMMFSQYLFLIVDRGLGPLEALRNSREVTRGNKSALLGIFFVTLLPSIITASIWSTIRTGNVRIYFDDWFLMPVMPWLGLLAAVCYLIVSGQPTADRAAATQETAAHNAE